VAVAGVDEQRLRPVRASEQEVGHRRKRDRAAQPLFHSSVDVTKPHLAFSFCQNGDDGSSK